MVMLAGVMGGCASMPEPLPASQQAVSAPSASNPGVGTPMAAPEPAVPAPALTGTGIATGAQPAISAPATERTTPVDAQVQRAHDDARRLLAAGRAEDAERAFRAIATANPDLGGPHANLGLIYRQAGKPAEAVAELELAVRANPKQPVYFNQLGIAYRQAGQFAKARGAYERALELDPAYAAAMLNLGILNDLYLRDGQRALELYERHQTLTANQDAAVTKWVVELRNRKPEQRLLVKKEQP
jgi:Flp pilus assembly protein TadD